MNSERTSKLPHMMFLAETYRASLSAEPTKHIPSTS